MIGELKFKSDRDYLHGTDIFDAVSSCCAERFGDGFISRLEFRSFTDKQIRLGSGDLGATETSIGRCRYKTASGKLEDLDLVATEVPVTARYDYDEQAVTAGSQIAFQEQVIYSPVAKGFSSIEQIVALDKKLHYVLCPTPPGRWVFTRIQCSAPLPEIERFCSIKVTRMLSNKFSESLIEIDGAHIGTITFTVAPS